MICCRDVGPGRSSRFSARWCPAGGGRARGGHDHGGVGLDGLAPVVEHQLFRGRSYADHGGGGTGQLAGDQKVGIATGCSARPGRRPVRRSCRGDFWSSGAVDRGLFDRHVGVEVIVGADGVLDRPACRVAYTEFRALPKEKYEGRREGRLWREWCLLAGSPPCRGKRHERCKLEFPHARKKINEEGLSGSYCIILLLSYLYIFGAYCKRAARQSHFIEPSDNPPEAPL